jgi:Spy/CpxP family protein refolding chaperone
MKKWKTWLVIAAVFISGVLIGSAGTGLYMKHRIGGILHGDSPTMRKVIMQKLTAELNLTGDQQDEIDEIVEETQLQLQQLRAQYRPQMEAIINNGITTMKTRLSAEQQQKLDALYAKVKKHWSKRRNSGEKAQ